MRIFYEKERLCDLHSLLLLSISFERRNARAHHFYYPERLYKVDEAVELRGFARKLEHNRILAYVNGLCTVKISDFDELVPVLAVSSGSDEDMLAGNCVLKYSNLVNVIKLEKLIFNLVEDLYIALDNDCQARNVGFFRFRGVEAFDVEAAPAEKARNAQKNAVVVVNSD